ncbi:hypothetical protein [Ferrimicrobium acidiphilum]|uniref:hypothetical protein n=1 Tax=Ferrimicrobium acidiphilum TaxID=121039 RepID=UPI0023F569CC|nr:hypothetical protein [Ferrimicrobium acidiphilum]
MRKTEEVLRPSAQGKHVREISRSTGVSRTTVTRYLEKAAEHEIGWLLPAGMDVRALEQLLFAAVETPKSTLVIPNSQEVATDLQAHHNPTLQLVWPEPRCSIARRGGVSTQADSY